MEHLPVRQRSGENGRHTAIDVRPALSGGYVDLDGADAGAEQWHRWLQYWSAITRHRYAILLAAVVGVLVAVVVCLVRTPVYVASTTMEFQPEVSQQQPFEGMSVPNAPFLLQTQVQLLTSGILRDRVHSKLLESRQDATRLGTGNQDTEPAGDILAPVRSSLGRWFGVRSTSSDLEEAIASARSGLTVTPLKESRIVQISSHSPLPQVAADYVNTLAREFIEQNLEQRWTLYQNTGTWLERAQQGLKEKLEASEQQLLSYAQASGLVITSKDENVAEQQLIQVQAEVSKAQAERIAKESVYRTAMAQPAESLAEVLDQGPMTQYQAKLADLRRELADVSTSLMPAHPKVQRLEAQIQELESAKSREGGNILNRMRTDYESALRREQQLVAGLASQSRVLSGQDQKLIRYKMLQREVETYRKLYETLLERGKEASVTSALRPVSARIVDAARVPRQPSTPNVGRSLIVGLLGGSLLGVGLVLFRERTDASIRVPGSVPLYLNLRELGVIPSADSEPDLLAMTDRQPSRFLALPPASHSRAAAPRLPQVVEPVALATWNRKSSMLAESFRATLTSILSSPQNGRETQVILVASPSPQEGKSTVITNLAIALAEINQRVLLVDADMRRPRLHAIFSQANSWGLSDLLREKTPCVEYREEALARKTHIPRLSLLPSGPGSVNVSRLLHSTRMAELLERLREEFDAILIDTPPVLQLADARILSRHVDAVVLVFRAGQTTREAAATAVNVFEADGVPVLGTVLNDWNPRTMGGGYYSGTYSEYYPEASNL